MADCAPRRRPGARLALVALSLAVAFGCHRHAPAPKADKKPDSAGDSAKDAKPQVAADPRLNQSFKDATRADPPAEAPRPPDTTVTNKSVGKLYTDVARLWTEIPFVTAEGKRIEYGATLETDLGTIEMALLPDAAPNHVRNFVALARAGYYDGLSFDRIQHAESDVSEFKGRVLDTIEAGDPLGADDLDEHDSIGYWLQPEFDDKLDHVEGNVEALRGVEPDSAACKFYILLSKEPPFPKGIYTVFGKVTKGLDVAHKIHQQPVKELEPEFGYTRPETPVIIRKVTITTKEVDTPGASSENK